MTIATAFLAGLVFGLGLILSGMANPVKVLAFLDIAGAWDPSLLLVMVGAIAVSFTAFRAVRNRTMSALGMPMLRPSTSDIDKRLLGGSLCFGAGWALAGFCPGPALVALGAGYAKAAVFVGAMLIGLRLVDGFSERRRQGYFAKETVSETSSGLRE